MSQSIHFLVNPNSAGGSVGKHWESLAMRIESTIGPFSYTFTQQKGDGSSLAKLLIDTNPTTTIVVLGGDGTVSEVVDGVMRSSDHENVSLAIVNLGTGGDFCKSLGVPHDLDSVLARLANPNPKSVDGGKISYRREWDGSTGERYFINITGCGMAGEVVRSVNQSAKRFGAFSYYLGSLANVLSYQNKPIRFRLDDGEWEERTITTLAVCNGRYFGGGMCISPESRLDDGFLDIVCIGDWNLIEKAMNSGNFYNGNILSTPGVESFPCQSIEIQPMPGREEIKPAIIDCDGEDIGTIPMRVEIVPRAIQFLV